MMMNFLPDEILNAIWLANGLLFRYSLTSSSKSSSYQVNTLSAYASVAKVFTICKSTVFIAMTLYLIKRVLRRSFEYVFSALALVLSLNDREFSYKFTKYVLFDLYTARTSECSSSSFCIIS